MDTIKNTEAGWYPSTLIVIVNVKSKSSAVACEQENNWHVPCDSLADWVMKPFQVAFPHIFWQLPCVNWCSEQYLSLGIFKEEHLCCRNAPSKIAIHCKMTEKLEIHLLVNRGDKTKGKINSSEMEHLTMAAKIKEGSQFWSARSDCQCISTCHGDWMVLTPGQRQGLTLQQKFFYSGDFSSAKKNLLCWGKHPSKCASGNGLNSERWRIQIHFSSTWRTLFSSLPSARVYVSTDSYWWLCGILPDTKESSIHFWNSSRIYLQLQRPEETHCTGKRSCGARVRAD